MAKKYFYFILFIFIAIGLSLPYFYAQKTGNSQTNLSLDTLREHLTAAMNHNYDTILLYKEKKQLEKAYLPSSKNLMEISDTNTLAKFAFLYRVEGTFLSEKKSPSRAIKAYQTAIQLHQKLNDSLQIAEDYYHLGNLYERISLQTKAIDCYKIAVIFGKIYRSDYYMSLGKCYTQMGDYEQALAFNDSALHYSNSIDLYIERGNIFDDYEKWDSTFYYRNKVLTEAIKEGDNMKLHNAHLNLANLYKEQKQYDAALSHYQKALFFAQKSKSEEAIWLSLNNLTVTYTERKEYRKAFSNANEALQIAHNFYGNKHPNIGITQQNIGEIYDSLKQWDSAIIHYKKAIYQTIDSAKALSDTLSIPNLRNCDHKIDLLSQLKDLADAYLHLDKTKTAFRYYQKADALIDIIRAEHSSQDTKLFWREKARNLYENAIESAFLLAKKDSVFYFMEKSRAILLLEELQKHLVKTENDSSATTPIATINDIQQHFCQNNRTFISYFIAKNKLYVSVIQQNKINIDTLTQASNFQAQIDTLSVLISDIEKAQNWDRYEAFYKKESHSFYEKYIAPLNLPPSCELIISLDKDFWKIPIESLWNGKEYLVENYAINYAYSGSVLLQTTQRKPITNNKNYGVFAPVHFSDAPSLLATKSTIEQLQNKDKLKLSVFMEEKATYAAFQQNAAQYSTLWLATHASGGENPYIMLRDKNVSLSDIYQKTLNAAIVILSACESSSGKLTQGEGMMSLARGFAYAGVPITIAAKWKVAEGKTMEIIADFLKSKETNPALALQQAKKALIGNPPYYWSGIVMMGCKANDESFSYLPILLIVGIGIILLMLIVYYKKKQR